MPLTLHSLKPFPKSRRRRKRIGRGPGSGHGTYSTRGIKGQRARSGGRKGLKKLGLKRILQNIPKKRGFKSIHPQKKIVNLGILTKFFQDGEKVTPEILQKKGLVDNIKTGVKILAQGEFRRRLIIEGCDFSKNAEVKIKKAGGEVKK